MLKFNGPNSISKDALRDEGYSWLINSTTQKYLANVRQDSHFNNNSLWKQFMPLSYVTHMDIQVYLFCQQNGFSTWNSIWVKSITTV